MTQTQIIFNIAAVDCVRTKPKKRMAALRAAILFLGFAFVLIHLATAIKTGKASLIKNYLGFSLKVLSSFVK
ncbi:hypothetical protein [Phormidium tenue]|uniref:hypothetical protein n=1 Tax=Phormidium tenue TaxID=126344 RepID=UPI0030D71D9B